MSLNLSSGQFKIFTFEDFVSSHAHKNTTHETLYNLLFYHQKKGHIMRIRRGLYCVVPQGINPHDCPVDSFLVTSKMTADAVLAYRTALDFFGKLHTITNEFLYLSKKNESKPFIFRGITYRAISIPTALKKSDQIEYGVECLGRGEQKVRVTSLERTFVDILDRPRLCGSWEEIWRSFENIEYLDLDKVVEYALLLHNTTTIAKVGFFLETHREEWMVSESYLNELQRHLSKKPLYLERGLKEPHKLITQWNLIVPLSIINRQWEEPHADT
jgi:predicted transcriptional regulator of viral defense system